VQLFIERARRQLPSFELTSAHAGPITELCIHLDGIPLALELAAARIRTLSVEQINARLDDRFKLLTTGDRKALPHQQTLRATLDWSHELLAAPERALLRRLAVFPGSSGAAACTCSWGSSMRQPACWPRRCRLWSKPASRERSAFTYARQDRSRC
jgi:predicted ATPase